MKERDRPRPPDVTRQRIREQKPRGRGRGPRLMITGALPKNPEQHKVNVDEVRDYLRSVEKNKKLRLHPRNR